MLSVNGGASASGAGTRLSPGRSRRHFKHSPRITRKQYGNINVDNERTAIPDNSVKVPIQQTPFADVYQVVTELGRGKFAVVKKVKQKENNKEFAAKFLRKRRGGKDCREDIIHEVKMLELALDHPRLVQLIQLFETSHELILVMEYAAGGELFHYVMIEEGFEEKEVVRMMKQILEALVFLHQRDIVHLDIKPQNILLTAAPPTGDIKLCDFGFSRTITSQDDVRDIIGTPDYVAPEVLSYEPLHTSCDMWSVGVLVYVLLTGCSPFAGDNKMETFSNITQLNLEFPAELFGNISHNAVNFIKRLLVREPEERMTALQCFSHPWMRGNHAKNNENEASLAENTPIIVNTPSIGLDISQKDVISDAIGPFVDQSNVAIDATSPAPCNSVDNNLNLQNEEDPQNTPLLSNTEISLAVSTVNTNDLAKPPSPLNESNISTPQGDITCVISEATCSSPPSSRTSLYMSTDSLVDSETAKCSRQLDSSGDDLDRSLPEILNNTHGDQHPSPTYALERALCCHTQIGDCSPHERDSNMTSRFEWTCVQKDVCDLDVGFNGQNCDMSFAEELSVLNCSKDSLDQVGHGNVVMRKTDQSNDKIHIKDMEHSTFICDTIVGSSNRETGVKLDSRESQKHTNFVSKMLIEVQQSKSHTQGNTNIQVKTTDQSQKCIYAESDIKKQDETEEPFRKKRSTFAEYYKEQMAQLSIDSIHDIPCICLQEATLSVHDETDLDILNGNDVITNDSHVIHRFCDITEEKTAHDSIEDHFQSEAARSSKYVDESSKEENTTNNNNNALQRREPLLFKNSYRLQLNTPLPKDKTPNTPPCVLSNKKNARRFAYHFDDKTRFVSKSFDAHSDFHQDRSLEENRFSCASCQEISVFENDVITDVNIEVTSQEIQITDSDSPITDINMCITETQVTLKDPMHCTHLDVNENQDSQTYQFHDSANEHCDSDTNSSGRRNSTKSQNKDLHGHVQVGSSDPHTAETLLSSQIYINKLNCTKLGQTSANHIRAGKVGQKCTQKAKPTLLELAALASKCKPT